MYKCHSLHFQQTGLPSVLENRSTIESGIWALVHWHHPHSSFMQHWMSPYSFIKFLCKSQCIYLDLCWRKNRSYLFYIPNASGVWFKNKLLWEQNCIPTKWVSHSTGVKGNLHFPNISSFGHISCLAPSFFMLHRSCLKKFRQVWVSKLFVSEQKRLHVSCFMAEACLLEESSDWA